MIECPHCGPRNSSEFSYSGLVKPRPTGDSVTPEAWRRYLYEQNNYADAVSERWFHVNGCRAFLDIVRHTVTNEITSVRRAGDTD